MSLAEANLYQVIQMTGAAGSGALSDTYYYLAEAYLGQGKIEDALATAKRLC